jgi:hypothetical protein
MMSRFQQRVLLATLAVLVVAVYIAGLRASIAARAEQSRPNGRFNYQQILAHSELPAFELFGDTANWHMTARAVNVFNRSGGPVHVWNVICSNSAGKELGFFDWNGDSGDLIHYSDQSNITDRAQQRFMSAGEAVAEAKRWLRELTINRETSGWKLATPPRHFVDVWVVKFSGRTGAADLKIDVRSGKLVSYYFLPA